MAGGKKSHEEKKPTMIGGIKGVGFQVCGSNVNEDTCQFVQVWLPETDTWRDVEQAVLKNPVEGNWYRVCWSTSGYTLFKAERSVELKLIEKSRKH